ncbi:MAG: NPCBM/NEW2 domain-containing protein [Elusimicrobiota bacterium]|nr:NPCBM/NEW2 domain-containing protein [Elusimicrobiota bacterium]
MGELLPASEIYLGFHALCLDEHRSTGPVTVGGRVFKEGIGVEINSSLIYALRGAYKKLDIKAGVSSEGKEFYSDKKVVFEVHGDGKLLYLGKEKKWNDAPDNISVSLEGIKLLRLKYGAFFV